MNNTNETDILHTLNSLLVPLNKFLGNHNFLNVSFFLKIHKNDNGLHHF
jgi:hypothetical protein